LQTTMTKPVTGVATIMTVREGGARQLYNPGPDTMAFPLNMVKECQVRT
jgi:hypothetical protein